MFISDNECVPIDLKEQKKKYERNWQLVNTTQTAECGTDMRQDWSTMVVTSC